MKLKTKLPLFTSVTVLISITLISAFSIYEFRRNTIDNIENYRKEETEKVKSLVKDVVDMAYEMITVSYQNSTNKELIAKLYGSSLADSLKIDPETVAENVLALTLENLRVMRYGKDGYIWINEIKPPYKVVMHPIKPELEGRAQVFYVGKGSNKNVYEVFAEKCNVRGEDFADYFFYRQGSNEMLHKTSYIKLFEPKGWVIGSGVYVDNIRKMVEKKTEELNNKINDLVWLTIIVGIALVAVASIVLYVLGHGITSAIRRIKDQLYEMARGISVEKLPLHRADEIGEIKNSADALIDGINSYSAFATAIGKGDLNVKFTPLSEQDELGNSLLEMRASLQKAKEEDEKRKEENEKRNWATSGLAKFGELLRQKSENTEEMAYTIISNLVEYTDSNQGGLFLFNEDQQSLELVASVAYDRRKFLAKRILPREGLVGMVAVENKTMYITNVPTDYLQVETGMGDIKPASLLLVPLAIEDQTFGVIEIAAFHKFSKYEIEFVEKISESIASTLSAAKITESTNKLLNKFKHTAKLDKEIAYGDNSIAGGS